MKKTLSEILNTAILKAEVYQHGIINTETVNFSEDVRKMCEVNTCGQYGKTWACPPGVGTVNECRQKCLKYNKMLVF